MADVADALIAPPDPSFGMSRNPYAQRIAQALVGMGQGMATLPQRAFGASETMRQGGNYDPGPILESAMLPMAGGLTSPVRTEIGEAVLGAGPTRGIDAMLRSPEALTALTKGPEGLRRFATEKGLSDTDIKAIIDDNYSSPKGRQKAFADYLASK